MFATFCMYFVYDSYTYNNMTCIIKWKKYCENVYSVLCSDNRSTLDVHVLSTRNEEKFLTVSEMKKRQSSVWASLVEFHVDSTTKKQMSS